MPKAGGAIKGKADSCAGSEGPPPMQMLLCQLVHMLKGPSGGMSYPGICPQRVCIGQDAVVTRHTWLTLSSSASLQASFCTSTVKMYRPRQQQRRRQQEPSCSSMLIIDRYHQLNQLERWLDTVGCLGMRLATRVLTDPRADANCR
jgi:hypothetical protein